MEPRGPYTQALTDAPVNPEREFARQMSDGGYAGGIAGSQGRSFARDAYESGGAFDNTLRQRQRAEEELNLGSKIVGSRNMSRPNWARMQITPPASIGGE